MITLYMKTRSQKCSLLLLALKRNISIVNFFYREYKCMCDLNGLRQCECGMLDYQNQATLNLDNANAAGLNISFTEDN